MITDITHGKIILIRAVETGHRSVGFTNVFKVRKMHIKGNMTKYVNFERTKEGLL